MKIVHVLYLSIEREAELFGRDVAILDGETLPQTLSALWCCHAHQLPGTQQLTQVKALHRLSVEVHEVAAVGHFTVCNTENIRVRHDSTYFACRLCQLPVLTVSENMYDHYTTCMSKFIVLWFRRSI